VEKVKEYALRVNPNLRFFEVSVKSGEGMGAWFDFLMAQWKEL
jgi:hydrogenase nickel incorporation protein HypB